jgi:hypothetical protein
MILGTKNYSRHEMSYFFLGRVIVLGIVFRFHVRIVNGIEENINHISVQCCMGIKVQE